jgi:hypothetical protein
METTTITTKTSPSTKRIAVNALAIVGFIVLIGIGMLLAVYAATFVPTAVNRLGSAAVYLSSVFVPAQEPATLEVVPGTTVPFPEAPVVAEATTTPVVAAEPATAPAAVTTPTAGPTKTTVYPVGTGTNPTPVLSGLSDLTVDIVATGYLTSSDTSTFIKSDTVPDDLRGAVKFTITNKGTNASGRFNFDATLPTTRTYTFTSDKQDSLLPGEHIDYVLGFDRARSGDDRVISITVDADNDVKESNESNNSDSVKVEIK